MVWYEAGTIHVFLIVPTTDQSNRGAPEKSFSVAFFDPLCVLLALHNPRINAWAKDSVSSTLPPIGRSLTVI